MLRLLDRLLPAVRLSRELAVTRERLSCADAQNTEWAQRYASLEARFNRLVDNRLFRTGDISEPLSSPPSTMRPPVHGPLGTAIGAIFAPAMRTAFTPSTPVEEEPVA